MTATISSAKDLLNDAEFGGFLSFWKEYKRCPLPLVDWLLEKGLERQAEVARWAATKDDRYYSSEATKRCECGPYPWHASTGHGMKWLWWPDYADKGRVADNLPEVCLRRMETSGYGRSNRDDIGRHFDTFELAIVALLDCLLMEDFDA